jgi:putative DNA primase/helicase
MLKLADDITDEIVKRAREKRAGKKPKWVQTDRDGDPLPTRDNFEALLNWMGIRPRRNLMSHQTEYVHESGDFLASECKLAAVWGDIIDSAIKTGLNKTQHFQSYLDSLEARNAYHPVSEWAMAKPWDGHDRIPDLLESLGIRKGFEPYETLMKEQLTRWLVSGGIALKVSPAAADGLSAEGVLVLQGGQGTGKTRWVKSLTGGNDKWIAESVILDPNDKDSVILATSTFISELGELDATYRKSDIAALKAFLTKDKDIYRSPYGKKAETYPRRTIFAATVNPAEFLADETGNRRFWLFPILKTNPSHQVDMQQVWAQAIDMAEKNEPHWLPAQAKEDAEKLASSFRSVSPWEDLFLEHYATPNPEAGGIPFATKYAQIREVIKPNAPWATGDVKSFAAWLRARCKAATVNGALAFYVVPKL